MSNLDISQLNKEQQLALQATEGPVLVTAGAGSGKTRLLTYRIAHLIKDKEVPAENILAITFTNKAANEMKERIQSMVDNAEKIWISTFHSMCCKILRKNIRNLEGYDSNFSIYSENDKEKVIKLVCEKLDLAPDKYKSGAYEHISSAKNENLTPWEYQKLNANTEDIDIYVKIYTAYQHYLKNNNALDFDDLLIKVYELFTTCPDILGYYQNKFQYIHVDEFQDTNTIQYLIVRMLAQKNQNVFVVGDEDQSIYGWRGANIGNIKSFCKDFPTCKIYKLEQNYRSTKQILTSANNLIKNNVSRIDKVLWTANTEGVRVEEYQSNTEMDEAEYVASVIYQLVNYSGYRYSDIAVLMRLNALSRPFEEKFLSYNIPHVLFGGFKFFERQEIKDIIAYLRLFVNPQDSTSLFRIINVPKRGIGDSTIAQLNELTEVHSVSPLSLIFNCDEYMLSDSFVNKIVPLRDLLLDLNENFKKRSPADFVAYLIDKTNLRRSYDSKDEDSINKQMNIDAFILSVQEYFEANPHNSLIEYLENITLIRDIDSYDDKNNSVTLATVHAAKGLEFKVVFIVGLEEKYFPIIRYSGYSDIEEERRLMYVAITRARERLYLTRARSRFLHGKRDYCTDSRFLKESEVVKPKTTEFKNVAEYDKNFPAYGYKVSFSLDKMNNEAKDKANEKGMAEFTIGAQVLHTKFGVGIVKEVNTSSRCITVDFSGFGVKTLLIDYAPVKVIKAKE